MPSYRAVVIGDSTRSSPYGHAIHRAWLGHPQVEIVALADPVEDARREHGAEIGAAKLYADYREMLTEEKPDLVAVCPHHFDLREQWLMAAIDSGARGIYTEKPIATSLASADRVVEAAERRNVKIAVAHQNRYRPGLRHAAELVRDGAIGKLRWIRAQGKCDVRGGTRDLMILGTHLLDISRSFAGAPRWATGHLMTGTSDTVPADVFEGDAGIGTMAGDSLVGYFAYETGAVGYFESFARAANPEGTPWFGFEVWGEEGGISIRDAGRQIYQYPAQAVIPGDSSLQWTAVETPPITNIDGSPAEGHGPQDAMNQQAGADVIRCIEQGSEPVSSAREARATLEMIMAIMEGHRTGARVTFPMTTREQPLGLWSR